MCYTETSTVHVVKYTDCEDRVTLVSAFVDEAKAHALAERLGQTNFTGSYDVEAMEVLR